MKLKIGLVRVSSYAGKATFSHGATLLFTSLPVTVGRDVLIVDDILASGNTLRLVQSEIRRSGARSVKTAALLRGAPFFAQRRVGDGRFPETFPARDSVPHPFLRKGWGTRYGLDSDGLYRNLPYIAVLTPAVCRRGLTE